MYNTYTLNQKLSSNVALNCSNVLCQNHIIEHGLALMPFFYTLWLAKNNLKNIEKKAYL